MCVGGGQVPRKLGKDPLDVVLDCHWPLMGPIDLSGQKVLVEWSQGPCVRRDDRNWTIKIPLEFVGAMWGAGDFGEGKFRGWGGWPTRGPPQSSEGGRCPFLPATWQPDSSGQCAVSSYSLNHLVF